MDASIRRQQSNATPPWQMMQARVTYIEPSPPVYARKPSRAESAASIPRLESSSGRGTPAPHLSPSYIDYGTRLQPQQGSHATRPYETRMNAPVSAPLPLDTTFQTARTPPTPPDSVKLSASRNNSQASTASATKAISGTMASQEHTKPRRARSQSRSEGIDGRDVDQAGFSRRFRTAMKDLFHRSPVDASECEPVKSRHWADDDAY